MTTQMSNLDPSVKRSRAIDRILHSRGDPSRQARERDPGEAQREDGQAFTTSGSAPQASFAVVCLTGEMHGFHYFNLDNLKFTPGKDGDYLSFDHRGKVVVMTGSNLKPIFQGMIQQTLVEVTQTGLEDAIDCSTRITKLIITDLDVKA